MTKTIIEIETDEGVTGLGEAADGDTSPTIDQLGERLIGLDPLDINECERRCVPQEEFAIWANLTAVRRAFGAIEMGLWDLRGRAEQRPLHLLLGGAVRREIAFTEYFAFRMASGDDGGESTPADIARCSVHVEGSSRGPDANGYDQASDPTRIDSQAGYSYNADQELASSPGSSSASYRAAAGGEYAAVGAVGA